MYDKLINQTLQLSNELLSKEWLDKRYNNQQPIGKLHIALQNVTPINRGESTEDGLIVENVSQIRNIPVKKELPRNTN